VADDLRRETEELLRYCGELTRRMGRGGIPDVASLVARYEQLKEALDAVSAKEVAWADERARVLIAKLEAVQKSLVTLRRLKGTAGGSGDAGSDR